MSIKYFLMGFLSIAILGINISNAKLTQPETLINVSDTLDRFVKEKAEKIVKSESYDYEKHPWLKLNEFRNTSQKTAEWIVRGKLLGPTDWLKEEVVGENLKSPSHENTIAAGYILMEMITENTPMETAIDNVRNKLSENKIIEEGDINSRILDTKKLLKAGKAEEIIKNINTTQLLKEFKNFLEQKSPEHILPPDYRKPLSKANLSIKYVLPKLNSKDEKTALYGIYSTRQNYESGKYISHKGSEFPLKKIEKAKNLWEILGIEQSIGNMELLNSTLEKKLKEITPKNHKTKVIVFKGTCQDAIIRSARIGNRVAIVSFANGETVAGGTLLGKNGQEESLVHCTPGLYESLMKNSENANNNKLSTYTNVYRSPELGLYTKGTKLIKRFINGLFFTLEKPVDINVISSAAINFGKPNGYKNNWFIRTQKLESQDPYIDIRRRIKIQLAIAILTGNDVLITGLFGCGNYNANKSKISTIYQEELKNPLLKDKLKLIVLTAGDKDLYSDFGF